MTGKPSTPARKKSNHPGSENLVDIRTRTTEEVRAITSKGGKRSVEARRQKKAIKNFLESISDIDMSDSQLIPEDVRQACLDRGIACTMENAMSVAVALKAGQGDVRAYEAVMDRAHGKPTQQVDLKADVATATMSAEELKAIRDKLRDD